MRSSGPHGHAKPHRARSGGPRMRGVRGSIPVETRGGGMRTRACSAKACVQCPDIEAARLREVQAARAISAMARLSAALVVDFTRIPSSIGVRSVLSDRTHPLNGSRNFSLSKCSRAIGRMESPHIACAMRYEDGSSHASPAAYAARIRCDLAATASDFCGGTAMKPATETRPLPVAYGPAATA